LVISVALLKRLLPPLNFGCGDVTAMRGTIDMEVKTRFTVNA
jgi:hypothetical protein